MNQWDSTTGRQDATGAAPQAAAGDGLSPGGTVGRHAASFFAFFSRLVFF